MTNKEALEILKTEWDINAEIFDTNFHEALNLAIKALEERTTGEWIRKEDVIHSIAKQYSEHNELVPIWLSIGDMKGGAK